MPTGMQSTWGNTNPRDAFQKMQTGHVMKPPTAGQTGMFGSAGTEGAPSFWKPPSGWDASTGNTQYDISGITGGMGMLKDPNNQYKQTSYNPYQFNKTSDKEYNDVYNQSMNVATRPVMAQGKERMRQATQGWGSGQMSGAAGKELAMKNAQATGSNVADIGKTIGADMSKARMAEGQAIQTQQATENFKAAGFTDEQAKYMAEDIMKRASVMIGTGQNWFNSQRAATGDMANQYNQAGFTTQ